MFTSQKIGRTVFVSLYFDKIIYYANAMDGMYVNAHKKWPSHKFLVCTSLLFNKNIPQVAARATRLQWLKIEQKHRMTSSTWFRGCRTKWVIGHRTWSIIGHSTIYKQINMLLVGVYVGFTSQCHRHVNQFCSCFTVELVVPGGLAWWVRVEEQMKFGAGYEPVNRSRPNWIAGPGPKLGSARKLERRGPENRVSRWRQPNLDIYSQNYHFGLVYDMIYQFLGMEANNYKFMFCQQCHPSVAPGDADIWQRNASRIHTCHLFTM